MPTGFSELVLRRLPAHPGHATEDEVVPRTCDDAQPGSRRVRAVAAAVLLFVAPCFSRAEEPKSEPAGPSLEDTLEAGEASVDEPRRKLVSWNEVDWYLSDNVRLEFAYGYGTLDRFDLEGATQFFQSRIQVLF